MVDHTRHPKPNPTDGQVVPQSAPGGDFGIEAGERVAKALARAGVASRREVERLIAEGRVALNGRVLTTPAVKVGRDDILTVNGAVVSDAEPTRLWRYHKPIGLVTTHADPKGRPTVFENLPPGLPRVISIGRLDLSSEGLLLLTNDGGLARSLELPSTGLMRRYRARAYGQADQAKLDSLKDGVVVEDVAYGAIDARLDKARGPRTADGKGPANLWITVTLAEGKNREIRRVLEHLGLQVNRLIRLAYGPFALGVLERGSVEEVGPRVIRELLSDFISPQNLPKGDRVGVITAANKPVRPSAKPQGAPRRSGAQDPSDPSAAKSAKPVYKAGWAKPKKRPAAATAAAKRAPAPRPPPRDPVPTTATAPFRTAEPKRRGRPAKEGADRDAQPKRSRSGPGSGQRSAIPLETSGRRPGPGDRKGPRR